MGECQLGLLRTRARRSLTATKQRHSPTGLRPQSAILDGTCRSEPGGIIAARSRTLNRDFSTLSSTAMNGLMFHDVTVVPRSSYTLQGRQANHHPASRAYNDEQSSARRRGTFRPGGQRMSDLRWLTPVPVCIAVSRKLSVAAQGTAGFCPNT
jgi:hypothetical protein